MRKRLVKILFSCLIVLFSFNLMECSKTEMETLTNEKFELIMEDKLYNITNPKDSMVALSSNPYDYIKDRESNEDYKYIISQGEKALNYMLKRFEKSNNNGLEEYIMAIACSEILEENSSDKDWATGKEWYKKYQKNLVDKK